MTRLKLYVTGRTVSAERARQALRDLERRLNTPGREVAVCSEVIDVLDAPDEAARDQIFATPTLVRVYPGPAVRLFGDLSSVDKVIAALKLDTTPRTSRFAQTA